MAKKYNVSASAVALAWLLAQDSVAAPIASGTKESHLLAFRDAVNLRLSETDLRVLQEASEY